MIAVKDTKAEFFKCQITSSNSGGNILTAQGFLAFKLSQSSVLFTEAAKMRFENTAVWLLLNRFSGNGSIELGFGKGLEGLNQAELAANRFEGVQLRFGNIAQSRVRLRNNVGTDHFTALQGTPKQCDNAGTGYMRSWTCMLTNV